MTENDKRDVVLIELSKQLTDRGKLIEAGWVGLRLAAIPVDAPQVQLDEMRIAFFAGAQHLFASIVAMMDPGAEPTEADLARMDQIKDELDSFIRVFKGKIGERAAN